MSSSDDDAYGRKPVNQTGMPFGAPAADDQGLDSFVTKTIEEARTMGAAQSFPGMPRGMVPMAAVELNTSQLKYVMDAFMQRCGQEEQMESLAKASPGMPPGMIPAVNIGPGPMPDAIPAAKLDAFIHKCAEHDVVFPQSMLPPTTGAAIAAQGPADFSGKGKPLSEMISTVPPENVAVTQGLSFEKAAERCAMSARLTGEAAYFKTEVKGLQGYTGNVFVKVMPGQIAADVHDEMGAVKVGLVQLAGRDNHGPAETRHAAPTARPKA